MRRKIGDRRGKPRFEIVGDLWGTVEASSVLKVMNLGRGGALLESTLPLAVESVHVVRALGQSEAYPVTIRVRHSAQAAGEGPPRYLVGVEFLNVTPALEAFLVRETRQGAGGRPAEA